MVNSCKAMSIVDLIVGTLIVAIIVVTSSGLLGLIKDGLVDSENYYEANKFSMATLESIYPLAYNDANLIPSPTPYPVDLPASNLRDNYSGAKLYTVTERFWDAPANTQPYKEIMVTTSWTRKGVTRDVRLGVLKRDDQN